MEIPNETQISEDRADSAPVTKDQLWEFFPSLVVYFRKKGLSLEEAEDVVQEAMVTAVEKLHTFRGESALAGWLFAIAKRKCLLFWRRSRARKRSGIEVPAVDRKGEGEPGEVLADLTADVEQRFLARERYDAMRREIPNLPQRMRVALVLFAVRGLPYKEIANHFQCSVNEVSSLVYQARQKLRRADPGRSSR